MTSPFSVVLDAFEVALAISFLLSLVYRGEQRSILGQSDGTGGPLVRSLRGFSRCAPSGVRESSRKLQIGAAVEFLQAVETEPADPLGRELAAVVTHLTFNTVNEEAELAGIQLPLVGGSVETAEQLLAVEGLAAAVALDHFEGLRNGALVGGEAVAARAALAPPANGAIGDAAGLEGLRLGVAAGTGH